MGQIVELDGVEQTREECPACGVEVTLASSDEATQATCGCADYLVA